MRKERIPLELDGWNGAYQFHISKFARIKYQFDETIFEIKGNAVLADQMAARVFAQKINDQQDLSAHPEKAIRASHVYAMGLLDEVLHLVLGLYKTQIDTEVLQKAWDWLLRSLGKETLDQLMQQFLYQFPSVPVFQDDESIGEYLADETDGVPNQLIALEELIMLWVSNQNPALQVYDELFSDVALAEQTDYQSAFNQLGAFFNYQPAFGPENLTLLNLLLLPAKKYPNSIFDQLEYIRHNWGSLVGDLLERLLRGLDFIKEEEKASFTGPGPITFPDFGGLKAGLYGDEEYERFSEDKYWMPRLVLMAKNTYVWLDQLSKKYKRDITRLDQVPDEELEMLARWGITGIWFIGLWERSQASRKIKQMMGQEEAVASAYSLYDYTIASDFGGDQALENLKARAWRYGIRLGSDMVPNHMGMDSNWVINHPDRFLSLPYPPFPSYTFNGPDLCDDQRVGVYLEDHYYTHSDAAVVFKRVDHYTGDTRYIYHGNDGTSMPWNDTAQLNFLSQEVREAVIQAIFNVARRFNIIRFDAAMTLAKKHIQRLWFPEPGSGGDIASRSEHGLTKADFDKHLPEEFWREVVDRVAEEVPDTLLLAEAFWMMEGYFVRTLGMHRVYNSAFMHIVRDEDNAKYRGIIKETIEFDPQILKRYVNFMNNPDEETAIDQFGDGDKYFGVCTLMATLPGLPMFGHGQVEGYHEKYGMEYRRAKWEEEPNRWLIERHERQIFPLLHRRYLFAEVELFRLFDFYHADGGVDENVYSYSNGFENQRGLVVYHNRFGDTRGWIKTSAAFNHKTPSGDQNLMQSNLGEVLGLTNAADHFVIFREHNSNKMYIKRSSEIYEKGLYFELHAYETQVYLDFEELQDIHGDYAQLEAHLGGRGVADIQEARKALLLRSILQPLSSLLNASSLRNLSALLKADEPDTSEMEVYFQRYKSFLDALCEYLDFDCDPDMLSREMAADLKKILTSYSISELIFSEYPGRELEQDKEVHFIVGVIFSYFFIRWAGSITDAGLNSTHRWMDELMLRVPVRDAFRGLSFDDQIADFGVDFVKAILLSENWFNRRKIKGSEIKQKLAVLLDSQEYQRVLRVNQYNGVRWFNQESCEEFIRLLWTAGMAEIVAAYAPVTARKKKTQLWKVYGEVSALMTKSGYDLDAFIALLSKGPA